MAIVINVGLLTNTNESLDLGLAIQTVNNLLGYVPAWNITDVKLVQSDSEPTLVIILESSYLWNAYSLRTLRGLVFTLADNLEQDCIALWNGYEDKGTLIGSNTESWGEFNPKYFFLGDGTRLSSVV